MFQIVVYLSVLIIVATTNIIIKQLAKGKKQLATKSKERRGALSGVGGQQTVKQS